MSLDLTLSEAIVLYAAIGASLEIYEAKQDTLNDGEKQTFATLQSILMRFEADNRIINTMIPGLADVPGGIQ